MKDVFWELIKWDARINLPIWEFDAPLCPLISVARAHDPMTQLIELYRRDIIDMECVWKIKEGLITYMGIDLQWTRYSLVLALRYCHLNMFEIFNCDMGSANMLCAALYYDGLERSKDQWNNIMEMLAHQINGWSITQTYGEWRLGNEISLDLDYIDYDVLYNVRNASKDQIRQYSNCKAILDYCDGNAIDEHVLNQIMFGWNHSDYKRSYVFGNEGFYEFIIDEIRKLDNEELMEDIYELVPRALFDALSEDLETIIGAPNGGLLTLSSGQVVRAPRLCDLSCWISFLVSRGLFDLAAQIEKTYANHRYGKIMNDYELDPFERYAYSKRAYNDIIGRQSVDEIMFILNAESLANYEAYYGSNIVNNRLDSHNVGLVCKTNCVWARQARQKITKVGNVIETCTSVDDLINYWQSNRGSEEMRAYILSYEDYLNGHSHYFVAKLLIDFERATKK